MKITTIGEVLIDLTQMENDATGDPCFVAHPGGAPANVAAAAAKLGCESSFVGCIGDDSFGRFLRNTLENCGVGTTGLQTTDMASTTIALVTHDGGGERSFSFLRKPGADQLINEELACDAVRGTGILHFGSVSLTDEPCRSATVAAVKAAKESGSLISYDPNYRDTLWPDTETAKIHIREVLPLCDIVKISEEEIKLLTDEVFAAVAAEKLFKQGIKLIIVTLGSKGALWYFDGQCGIVEGFRSKVADTNGAGDTFWGAVLSCIARHGGLSDLKPEDIAKFVKFANMAASLSVRKHGAIPAMPYLNEVEEALENA